MRHVPPGKPAFSGRASTPKAFVPAPAQLTVLVPDVDHRHDEASDYIHEVLVAVSDLVHLRPGNEPILFNHDAGTGGTLVTGTTKVVGLKTLAETLGRIRQRYNTERFVFFSGTAHFSSDVAEVEAAIAP